MHNLFLEKTITRFLFNVKIDKPVEPGKRNPPVCLDDSHSSVVNCSINKCQMHYKTLGLTTTTVDLTSMAHLHISNWYLLSNQWCQAATPLHQKNLITLYDKDINWCFLFTQLKIAEANNQTRCVEDFSD